MGNVGLIVGDTPAHGIALREREDCGIALRAADRELTGSDLHRAGDLQAVVRPDAVGTVARVVARSIDQTDGTRDPEIVAADAIHLCTGFGQRADHPDGAADLTGYAGDAARGIDGAGHDQPTGQKIAGKRTNIGVCRDRDIQFHIESGDAADRSGDPVKGAGQGEGAISLMNGDLIRSDGIGAGAVDLQMAGAGIVDAVVLPALDRGIGQIEGICGVVVPHRAVPKHIGGIGRGDGQPGHIEAIGGIQCRKGGNRQTGSQGQGQHQTEHTVFHREPPFDRGGFFEKKYTIPLIGCKWY